MNFKEKLIKKWGEGTELNNCWVQKKLNFISDEARLNILFHPLTDLTPYKKVLGNVASENLLEFYSRFNGCKLFSNSLCIYGLQEKSNETYQTYDLKWENNRVKLMLELNDYTFFGSLGGQYLFALKSDTIEETIYCINIDNGEVVKKFDNFNLLFSTLFNNLYKEYDENGQKTHKNKDFKNIKSLFNTTIEKKFLEEINNEKD